MTKGTHAKESELLDAYNFMSSVEQEIFIELMEAMISGQGVREAGILFLETFGVANPALVADRILHDADGVA